MAKRRPQKILFPSGGLSKSTALQAQPPFTSPSLLNVFPWDTSDKSSRGGVRPGTSKFLEQLESGPIRSLVEYREIFSQPNKNLSDYFPWPEGRDLSNVNPFWVAADFTSGLRPPKTYQRKYAVAQGDTREDAAVVTNLLDVDYDRPWLMHSEFGQGATNSSFFEVYWYALLDDEDPDPEQNGVTLWMVQRGFAGEVEINCKLMKGGTERFRGQETADFLFKNNRRAEIRGTVDENISANIQGVGGFTFNRRDLDGRRFGFRLKFINPETPNVYLGMDNWQIQYEPVGGLAFNRSHLFITTGIQPDRKAYKTLNDGSWLEIGGYEGLQDNSQPGGGVGYLGRVYLTHQGIGNAPGEIIEFDPDKNTVDLLRRVDHPQKAGSVPQADIVASFQDALVAAGDITDPHIWYMSRQGVPYDWDYGAIDEGRAIASTSLPGGRIPQPITALANLVDDYLILGCTSSMYIMRGDPRVGGRIDLLSDRAGIFDSQAWCHLPDGTILALSHFAIHHIVPGSGAEVSVRDLSEGALPDEFLHFSRSQHYVNMVYDLAHRGAYIFFTPRDARAGGKKKGVAGDQPEFTNSGGGNGGGGGNEPPPTIGGRGQHWFWSWDTKGFFPVILANGQDPMAALYYDSDIPSDRGVLLGCLDGQMRKIDRSSSTDDEVLIDNFAVLGPFKLTSSEHVSAVLLEAIPVFSHATGEVNWGVVGDDYPERVIERAIDDDFDAEGVWESGLGFHEKPAVRGTYFAIKISGNGRTHWSLEAVSITAREAGRTLRA